MLIRICESNVVRTMTMLSMRSSRAEREDGADTTEDAFSRVVSDEGTERRKTCGHNSDACFDKTPYYDVSLIAWIELAFSGGEEAWECIYPRYRES